MTKDDMRVALRAAMEYWYDPLTSIAWIPPRGRLDQWNTANLTQSRYHNEILWLACKSDNEFRQATRALEATVLFALLSCVDLVLWRDIVRELDLPSSQWEDFFASCPTLTVGMDLWLNNDDGNVHESMRNIIKWLNAKRSRKYKQTSSLMTRALGVSMANCPIVPIRINHIMDTWGQVRAPMILGHMRELLATQSNVSSRKMRVTDFKTDSFFQETETTMLKTLVSIQDLSINITELPMPIVRLCHTVVNSFVHCWTSHCRQLKIKIRSSLQYLVVGPRRPLSHAVPSMMNSCLHYSLLFIKVVRFEKLTSTFQTAQRIWTHGMFFPNVWLSGWRLRSSGGISCSPQSS